MVVNTILKGRTMSDRKEEIIFATLELAAQKGLGSVSMNMIAEKVGIRKPSLYNHFSSKEELVQGMYEYLREKAKENELVQFVDYTSLFAGKTALEILEAVVGNYEKMTTNKEMMLFYKVIYSERSINPVAAKIMETETRRMILATKQLFYALQVHGLLDFSDPDMSAVSFAMTVHGLMDLKNDEEHGNSSGDTETKLQGTDSNKNLMKEYLQWFCKENAVKEREG
jgi:AcrR family transcriptional regulator